MLLPSAGPAWHRIMAAPCLAGVRKLGYHTLQ
jgi:hypothetical protein